MTLGNKFAPFNALFKYNNRVKLDKKFLLEDMEN